MTAPSRAELVYRAARDGDLASLKSLLGHRAVEPALLAFRDEVWAEASPTAGRLPVRAIVHVFPLTVANPPSDRLWPSQKGRTALHVVAFKCHECLEFLLDLGMDLEGRDEARDPPVGGPRSTRRGPRRISVIVDDRRIPRHVDNLPFIAAAGRSDAAPLRCRSWDQRRV